MIQNGQIYDFIICNVTAFVYFRFILATVAVTYHSVATKLHTKTTKFCVKLLVKFIFDIIILMVFIIYSYNYNNMKYFHKYISCDM